MMEVLTQLAAQSREAMTAVHKVELLDPLKSGVSTTDFLTRFNVIEILADVSKPELFPQQSSYGIALQFLMQPAASSLVWCICLRKRISGRIWNFGPPVRSGCDRSRRGQSLGLGDFETLWQTGRLQGGGFCLVGYEISDLVTTSGTFGRER